MASGAGSFTKSLIRIPSAVMISFSFLYTFIIYSGYIIQIITRIYQSVLTDGLISCMRGRRLSRILLRVYSSSRLVLSVT